MKHKIKEKATRIAKDPKIQKAFLSMKPKKNIWGIVGILVFFFLPELIAFVWAPDIVGYAQRELQTEVGFVQQHYYEFLISIFEDGVSWFNLVFGSLLLVWLFF